MDASDYGISLISPRAGSMICESCARFMPLLSHRFWRDAVILAQELADSRTVPIAILWTSGTRIKPNSQSS
jgi:hypothetical protein